MEKGLQISILQLYIRKMNCPGLDFYLLPINLVKLLFKEIELKEFVVHTLGTSHIFLRDMILRL